MTLSLNSRLAAVFLAGVLVLASWQSTVGTAVAAAPAATSCASLA